MPIHDWSRVEAGVFHHFHQAWTIEIANALNAGRLPPGFFALAEQVISGPIPDVVTLGRREEATDPSATAPGIAVAERPPQARFVTSAQPDRYAARANRIAIQHPLGHVVAVIEVVSPGNKTSQRAIGALVEKASQILRQGVHLVIVDLFPPSPRDPQGIHKAIWDEIRVEPFELPPDKPLTAAAYSADSPVTAYIEPLAVGDRLPELPLFLQPGIYVPTPLETTYEVTWSKCPSAVKEVVQFPEG